MRERTVFDRIIAGEIPCEKVFETESVLGLKDIHPKAPTHLLFIAKKEEDFVPSIADITDSLQHVPTMLIRAAQQCAQEKGITGFKLLFNVGKEGGQEVMYLHLHLLSEQLLTESDDREA